MDISKTNITLFINNDVKSRRGAEKDDGLLRKVYQQSGFIYKENLSVEKIRKEIKSFLKPKKEYSSYTVIIGGHGRGESIQANGGNFITIDEICQMFQTILKCKKNTAFLILQTCRGEKIPDQVEKENIHQVYPGYIVSSKSKMPGLSVLYSTVDGYKAFRSHKYGSYLFRAMERTSRNKEIENAWNFFRVVALVVHEMGLRHGSIQILELAGDFPVANDENLDCKL